MQFFFQCSNNNCRVAYHPLCARAADLCVEVYFVVCMFMLCHINCMKYKTSLTLKIFKYISGVLNTFMGHIDDLFLVTD